VSQATAAARPRQSAWTTLRVNLVSYGGLVVFVLALWWAIAALNIVNDTVIPPPSAVWEKATESYDDVLGGLPTTLFELAVSFAIVWSVGLIIGTLLAGSTRLEPFLNMVRSAYALPVVVVYPILIVWFGYEAQGKIVFGVLGGIPPMILMTASAVKGVDPAIPLLFRAVGAPRRTAVFKGVLPASFAGIVGAMRLSGAMALGCVITGELLASSKGIGYFISFSDSMFDITAVYVGVITVVVFAFSMHLLLLAIEILLVPSRRHRST
jgi:ABC-type nitrate/sulfonate/bicarbonate transport system permease component